MTQPDPAAPCKWIAVCFIMLVLYAVWITAMYFIEHDDKLFWKQSTKNNGELADMFIARLQRCQNE